VIAMVLAAGLGTRLRPLTARIAKPALPLLGTTLLEGNLRLLARAGVDEVVVNAHHLPATVAAAARAAAERLGMRIHLSLEQEILGTGGALVAARPLLDRGAPFLLVNGDVLADLDPGAALAAHRASGADTTMVLRPMPAGGGYGAVEVDERGRVARIAGAGRELAPGERTTSWLFTGVHVLSPAIFEVLPRDGAPCVNRQGHAAIIARGGHVHAHLEPGGRWSDVGTPERYVEANLDLLEGRYALPSPFGAAVEGPPGVWIDPAATVEAGAVLEAPCYVGAGAVVRAGAHVGPRAVLLAGSECAGQLRAGVVAPGAAVERGARAEGLIA